MQRNKENGLSIYCQPKRQCLPYGRLVRTRFPLSPYRFHKQLLLAGAAALGLMAAFISEAEAQQVNLGTAAGFAVLAHELITNTGATVIGNAAVKADIGVSPVPRSRVSLLGSSSHQA